jgi:hypothetical protein
MKEVTTHEAAWAKFNAASAELDAAWTEFNAAKAEQ